MFLAVYCGLDRRPRLRELTAHGQFLAGNPAATCDVEAWRHRTIIPWRAL